MPPLQLQPQRPYRTPLPRMRPAVRGERRRDMRRRSRLLRIAKWGGVVMCAVIAITLITSRWYWIAWTHSHGHVLCSNGVIRAVWVPPEVVSWTMTYGHGVTLTDTNPGLRIVPLNGPALEWIPWYQTWSYGGNVTVNCPLWMPFVLFAVPTALLWRLERRRHVGSAVRGDEGAADRGPG